MQIRSIIDKVNENQLFVPAFQREYVWKRADAKDLISSLIKDYPTGTLLIWETNNPPELKGEYKYTQEKGSVKLILDGQQRVTTLYMLITGKIPPYYNEKEIQNDIRNLYVNVETLELEYFKKTIMEHDPLWINITQVFKQEINALDIIDDLEKKNNDERLDKARQSAIYNNIKTIENIINKNFPEQEVPTQATIKEAIDIFYIVNASGVNLTDAELALAQISGYWPEARQLFKKKLDDLKSKGWVFNLDFIVYVLLGIMHHMGSKMEKLHAIENNDF